MKKFIAMCLTALISFVLTSYVGAQQNDFPVLKGPYLGQKPPGDYPEIFAPEIISVDANFEHSAAVFSTDGNEVFWCTNVGWYTEKKQQGMLRLYFMKMIDGQWTPPRIAPFVRDNRVERPVFSPDGNKLYLEFSVDPVNPENNDIFVVEREGEGWSEPKSVSPLINTPAWERLHCITADGSLYFSRNPMTSREEVLVSKLANGKFTEPEVLDKSYNSEDPELAIIFGKNEEFMLIDQKDNPYTSNLYISYKNADGTWTDRIKTPYECGGFLSLSPDGKYLFFLGDGIYWVSTSFVEKMRPK
jgi:hypothetical protein